MVFRAEWHDSFGDILVEPTSMASLLGPCQDDFVQFVVGEGLEFDVAVEGPALEVFHGGSRRELG